MSNSARMVGGKHAEAIGDEIVITRDHQPVRNLSVV